MTLLKDYIDTRTHTAGANAQFLVSQNSAWIIIGATAGSDLTDADLNKGVSDGFVFFLPASTLSGNHTLTLNVTGVTGGEVIEIYRLDATAHTYAIINGGTSAGTMLTMATAVKVKAAFRYDSGLGDWILSGWQTIATS